ncbi:MAG: hypothetical protein V4726_10975 [Verrucomicrobiota bacterium]
MPLLRLSALPSGVRALRLLLCALAMTAPAGAEEITDDGRVVISTALSPQVAWRVARVGQALHIDVSAAAFSPSPDSGKKAVPGIRVDLGLASGAREIRLSPDDARLTSLPGGVVLFSFVVPAEKLMPETGKPDDLRMGLAVEWGSGVSGPVRQRETFLIGGGQAPHAGLGPAEHWQRVSIDEFAARLADHRSEAAFTFTQPMDGKATVVIDDARGRRVRNLLAARTFTAGSHRLVWDVCDDGGNLLPPGDYHWRSISHEPVKPVYEFSFCNGPGSNHGTFHAAATNGRDLFFGTPVSEGGYQLVHLDPQGNQLHGFNAPNGIGLGRVAIAADERYLYAAYDGSGWGEHVNRSRPDWRADYKISLLRFDLKSGGLADFGGSKFVEIHRYTVGPGSPEKRPDEFALSGLALVDGGLYLADAALNRVSRINPATGAVTRTFSLDRPAALAAGPISGSGALFALASGKLVEVDTVNGGVKRVIAALEGQRPSGLATGPDGSFFVSDESSRTVRVLTADGKPQGGIGTPGGVKPGAYDPQCLTHPAGLVVSPAGQVWITESERWKPKRLAAFTWPGGQVWKEFFGPTAYGASGSGFDPLDITKWVGQGTMFQLDFAAGTALPVSTLGGMEGRSSRYWRQDGRTFLITTDKATGIQELLPDNTLKLLAIQSTAHTFSFHHGWRPPAAFAEAFNRTFPGSNYRIGTEGRPGKGHGMLWVDRNGNGVMDAEEIEFATAAENLGGAYWGNDFADLTLRIPGIRQGKPVLVSLKPDGWWPGGAPKYPALNDAVRSAVPAGADGTDRETTVDRFGNMIINGDPVMSSLAPDGRVLWTYPNRWSGVHGSHDAPLPTAGELQGTLFFTGVAPLDEQSDVIAMNGNHGRLFLMTSDGLFLDEMFTDCRLMTNPQANGVGILGGECFGGTFGKDLKSGNFYFQGGGIEYRIYRVEGLKSMVRAGGGLTVSADQVMAAERRQARRTAEVQPERRAVIAWSPPASSLPLENREPMAQWSRGRDFPVAVRAVHDGSELHISWTVKDGSPWVNGGRDWQMLFKTGDSVDLQLGTDPAAPPGRGGPVPGDARLLIAPFGNENIAVLYRHRMRSAKTPEPERGDDSVVFQSPWRNERVDSLKRLTAARITVKRQGDSYQVEAAVPLADLGLSGEAPGRPLRGDFGVIYGDASGTTNIFRNYWSNQATGLVNDVPGEIMLTPRLWGEINFEKRP